MAHNLCSIKPLNPIHAYKGLKESSLMHEISIGYTAAEQTSSFRQPHSVHSPPGSPHPAHYHLITVTNFYHFFGLSLQT